MKKFTQLFITVLVFITAGAWSVNAWGEAAQKKGTITLQNVTTEKSATNTRSEVKLTYDQFTNTAGIDKIQLNYYRNNWKAESMYLQYSLDGSTWSDVQQLEDRTSYASSSIEITIGANHDAFMAKRFRVITKDGTLLKYSYYVKDFKVTSTRLSKVSESTLDFGDLDYANANVTMTKSFTLTQRNLEYDVQLELNSSEFSIISPTNTTISKTAGAETGTTVTIQFNPTSAGAKEATLKVKVGTTNYSIDVPLSGNAKKLNQEVTWPTSQLSLGEELTAGEITTSTGYTPTLSSTNTTNISIEDNYRITGLAAGNAIVSIHVDGNDFYNAYDDTKELTITNLLTTYIDWDQTKDLTRLTTAMSTFNLNADVKGRASQASTGKTVTYTSSNTSVVSVSGSTLTIKGKGTCTLTATSTTDATYLAPVPVTLNVRVRIIGEECTDYVIASRSGEKSLNTIAIGDPLSINAPAYQVKVEAKKENFLASGYFFVQETTDGTNWTDVGNPDLDTDYPNSPFVYNLSINATAVRCRTKTGATFKKYYRNLVVTQATYLNSDVESITVNAAYEEELDRSVVVSYSNLPGTLEPSLQSGQYVTIVNAGEFGGDCGDFGTHTVNLKIKSTKVGLVNDKLIITGPNSWKLEIPITINTGKMNNAISHNVAKTYNTTDQISISATANSGLTNFTYTLSNNDGVAQLAGTTLTFLKSGTFDLTIVQEESNEYKSATNSITNITVNKTVPTIAEKPSVAPIKYKDGFANGLLSGGKATVTLRGVENTEVEGTFGWTNSGNVAEGEGSHDYSVTFTPTNGNMYAPKEFTLPVTVSRAAGGIVMKDGSVKVKISNINDNLDECKIALNGLIQSKINDAGHEGAVSYVFKDTQTKNTTGAEIDDNNIFSATVVGTYTLVAKQAQTDYYTEATDEFDIVVEQVVPTFNGTDNYSMKVSAEQPEAFSFVDVETLVPHITHHINEINNGDGQVIEYDEVNNKIIAHNAGTAEIYFTQAETETNAGGTSAVFHYTVTKHEPKFTWNKNNKEYYYESTISNIFESSNTATDTTVVSNNPTAAYVENNTLHILNVEENTTFTLRQAENYYWAAKDTDITITPKVTDNHVTFTIDEENKDYMVTINNTDYVEWDNNGYKMGNSVNGIFSNAPETYVIISFTGTPEKLTFTKTCDRLLGFLPVTGECLFEVYESANGKDWGSPIWSFNEEEESRDVTDVPPLNPTTRYLKLRYHGTICGHFNNIKVTELKRFDADKETVDFGEQGAAFGVQEMQLNFTHANAGRTTNMEIVGPDAAYFSVEPNVLPETGRDITGTVNFHITFDNGKDRRDTNPYNAELVFTDNLGHEERVTLTGVRDGLSLPTFTFNPNNLPYYYGSTIANVAVSTNTDYTKCPLSYQTSDSVIAYVDETGLHIGQKEGEVTITVHQGEGGDFRDRSEGFTFTPRERPSLHTPFVVTSDVLNGAGKKGDCSWTDGYVKLGKYEPFNYKEKSFTLVFDGMPDSLSFQIACQSNISTGVAKWEVKESADGAHWTQVWLNGSYAETDWSDLIQYKLKEDTRYLQFFYRGNYAGYWKNIKVTGIEGYAFLRAGDGQYLSRGADWSTRAIVDEYGVACRITRTTDDNTNYKTRLQFADSEQYMFESGDAIYTDHAGRTPIYWNIVENGGTVTIQSANNTSHNGHYVTVNEDGVLAFTSDAAQATHWYKDGAAQYQNYITQKLDQQATAAAQYDFEGLTTLAAVRKELNDNEYDFNVIDVPAVAEYIEQKGDYRNGTGVIQNNYEYVAEDLIPGFYKLTVQGFNRMGSQKAAYTLFANNMESSLAYIYANDVKYPMMSLLNVSGRRSVASPTGTDYYYPDGYFYADDKEAALVSFANEKAYLNDVYVYVNADEGKETGTLRYGIRNTSYINGAWLIYGNIKLYRLARAEFVFGGEEGNTSSWGTSSNWNRKDDKTPTDKSVVIVKQDAEISGLAEVYSLTIDAGVTVTVKSGATLKIHDGNPFPRTQYGNLHVENGGKVILNEGELRVNDFYLDAELGNVSRSAASGQISGEQKLNVARDAYFQLTLDPAAGRNTLGWYDFVVPFAVDVIGGISIAGDESTPMQFNVNYAVMDYSEAKRAVNGKAWNKFHGTMQPGRVYTITLDETNPAWNTVIFKKKSGAPVTGNRSFTTDFCGAGESIDNGWNGFGNGSLHHAELDVDESTLVQIYDHTNRCYQAREAHNYSIAVGTSFFMQVGGVQTITLAAADNDNIGFLAPAREPRTVERFRLALRPEEAENAVDYLWVSANEDATGEYIIGKDVLKMGTINEAKVARMWSKRDGLNLCGNEMQLTATKAQCDLGLYVPQAGAFELEVEEAPADATLFLTYEGRAIWNLSMSPYTMDLSKGTTEGYGLRIIADRQTTTDIENGEAAEGENGVRKVLIDNVLYLITPDGKMYDVVGKGVKF